MALNLCDGSDFVELLFEFEESLLGFGPVAGSFVRHAVEMRVEIGIEVVVYGMTFGLLTAHHEFWISSRPSLR